MLKICVILLLLQNAIICEEIGNNSSSFYLIRAKRSSDSCGVSKKSEGLIIGGNFFEKGSHPWMAALLDDRKNPPSYFCGGVLISNKRVLSVAHCILDKSEQRRKLARDVIIVLGAHDLQKFHDSNRISKTPKKIIIHPNWNPKLTNYDADISVLTFEEEIHFTSSIQPICLWTSNNDPLASEGVVIGYGKSEDETKEHETTPKQLKIPIIKSNEDCFLKEPDFAKISSKRTFCAGSTDGSGPCLGDSGHGLFIKQGNIFYLRGLVSSSLVTENSCDTSKYAVFTNVLKYKYWINNPSDEYDIPLRDTISIDSIIPSSITERPQLQRRVQIDDSFCGVMSISAGLVQGGKFSKQNQFPWMAIFKMKDDGKWSHKGSGSLISTKHVVTRSRSVSYADDLKNWIPVGVKIVKVFLGTTKYDDLSQSGSLEIGVVKIVNHPKSREVLSSLHISVVSVVTLDREVVFSEFIRPVCLWPFGDDLSDFAGRDAYAVGYGVDHTGKHSLIRKHVRMNVTGIDQPCKNEFVDELVFQNETKLFCIKGNDDESPCFYDNHLYMKVESKWYLKGMISTYKTWKNTCKTKIPALCEDIATFIPWIQNQI